jgi:hypothetical protein
MSTALPAGLRERRRWWWRRLVPIASVALMVLVFEAGLRLSDHEHSFYEADPIRGWKLKPNASGWAIGERVMWVRINSDGLRDREHALAKPAHTMRIAVLGDSYMEAMNVRQPETFSAQLEQRLAGCAALGRRPEVINFGVSAYGNGQALLTYRHHAANYQPDVVVLAIYTANDIFDNLETPQAIDEADRPDPALVPPRPPPPSPPPIDLSTLPLHQRARLFVTTRSVAASMLYGGWGALRAWWSPPPAPLPAPADDEAIYRAPVTPRMAAAWRATESLLRSLARETAARGAELWIVTLSNAEQVHPSPQARRDFAARAGVEDLGYPERRLREFARAHGLRLVTLAEPLADYAAATGAWLHGGYNAAFPGGTGHWNDTAHRIAAGIVGDALCAGSDAAAK